MNFMRMEQHDWLQNGFFTCQGLHYIQDFSSEEFQAWIKKNDMVNQHDNTFC